MTSSYRQYLTVTPCVLHADAQPREIILHARHEHARTLLNDVTRIRIFPVDGTTIRVRRWGGFRKWLDELPPAAFRRLENGDLAVTVNPADEGEYSLCLDGGGAAEPPKELATVSVYALREDLFALRPFKGDLHTHSARSDGAHAPEYVAASYRKSGFDFMALTDHYLYEPSLAAQKAMSELGSGLLVVAGEEVHLPENGVHIVNFGGRGSVNTLAEQNHTEYFDAVKQYMAALPPQIDETTRFQVAASEWCFDRIRDFGGVALFCHPFWRTLHHNYIGEETIDLLLKRRRFDVLEVISGFEVFEIESNMLAVARWQEELAHGNRIPVVGVSDSHDCDGTLAGWYYTVAFAQELTFDALARALREGRGVAVHCPPGHAPMAVGDFRLVKFTYFLLREVFPRHDEYCRAEGEVLLRALAGEEPDARSAIRRWGGTVANFISNTWEKAIK